MAEGAPNLSGGVYAFFGQVSASSKHNLPLACMTLPLGPDSQNKLTNVKASHGSSPGTKR